MALTPSLLESIERDFPHLSFVEDADFQWSPHLQTISYDPSQDAADSLLLHELGHAQLKHAEYDRDVQLIAMETDAWESARTLAKTYGVSLSEDEIQDHLDTYRDWLHARSTCPRCEATGLQSADKLYRCVACGHSWRVNEARTCALRRYST